MIEAEMLRLHIAWIEAGTGTLVTTAEVTPILSIAFFAPILGAFFFIIAFGFTPVIEWVLDFIEKSVDKLYDFLN